MGEFHPCQVFHAWGCSCQFLAMTLNSDVRLDIPFFNIKKDIVKSLQ